MLGVVGWVWDVYEFFSLWFGWLLTQLLWFSKLQRWKWILNGSTNTT